MSWIELDKKGEPIGNWQHVHEDMDDGSIIGSFTVPVTVMNEMGQIGTITTSKTFTVFIRANERTIPHFHVYDKEGKDRKARDCKKGKKSKGFHACVEIRTNRYFKHKPYTDDPDDKMREELDKFMSTTRTEQQYSGSIGKTNYQYTIEQWNDNNAVSGMNNRVPLTTQQPNYKTIIDNL